MYFIAKYLFAYQSFVHFLIEVSISCPIYPMVVWKRSLLISLLHILMVNNKDYYYYGCYYYYYHSKMFYHLKCFLK